MTRLSIVLIVAGFMLLFFRIKVILAVAFILAGIWVGSFI